MEIKVILFIAFILISVISSIVKGLKNFNKNRPGQAPPPRRTETADEPASMEDVFRRIEEEFSGRKKEAENTPAPASYEEDDEYAREVYRKAVESAEVEYRKPVSLENIEEEVQPIEVVKRNKRHTPTLKSRISHPAQILDLPEGIVESAVELPETNDDMRKMVVWSAILNRPQY